MQYLGYSLLAEIQTVLGILGHLATLSRDNRWQPGAELS